MFQNAGLTRFPTGGLWDACSLQVVKLQPLDSHLAPLLPSLGLQRQSEFLGSLLLLQLLLPVPSPRDRAIEQCRELEVRPGHAVQPWVDVGVGGHKHTVQWWNVHMGMPCSTGGCKYAVQWWWGGGRRKKHIKLYFISTLSPSPFKLIL